MQTSTFLAQLIGPVLLVMGVGMVANRQGFRTMAEEFLASRALIFLAGRCGAGPHCEHGEAPDPRRIGALPAAYPFTKPE
jgi:hypothetical protein